MTRILCCVAVLSFAACGGDDEPEMTADGAQLSQALGTAAPLGYAAALAMAAKAGGAPGCASITSTCAPTAACAETVTITVGGGCPLPVGDVGSGSISVEGDWTSADQASFSTSFVGVDVGGRDLVVASVSLFSSRTSGDRVETSYLDQDVTASSTTGSTVSQSSWDVEVDTQGTLDDLTDDVIEISGTQQFVSGGETTQMVVSNAVMDPSCRLNPISGSAIFQAVGGVSVNQQILEFHAACDGRADVEVGISIGIGGGGGDETVVLDLLN